MIFKRAAAKLKAQDWTAIGIELVIVIIGVFIGTQVSNWNNVRLEQAKTEQMARDLQPELRVLTNTFKLLTDYYAVTRRYGGTAFAGWRRDPRVSDRDFVIAAYQEPDPLHRGQQRQLVTDFRQRTPARSQEPAPARPSVEPDDDRLRGDGVRTGNRVPAPCAHGHS